MNEAKELIYKSLALAALSHHWHLLTTGVGSYARHVTLGELYPYCHEIADTLAEKIQGSGEALPDKADGISLTFSAPEPASMIRIIEQFTEEFEEITEPPWLANLAQEIQGNLYNTLYKLKRLS